MLGRRKHRSKKLGNDEPEDIYQGLRMLALDAVTRGLGPPAPEHPDVSGLVVDVPAEGGFATVVALCDNTTSMYTSTGGLVRFHVLSPSAGRFADVPEDAFWGRTAHEMLPVIASTQEVISAIRAAAPG